MDGSALLLCALATGVAGCLGWGIRGVFGGPMGALVPGALMGGTAGLLAWRSSGLPEDGWSALLMAAGAAAFSIGGVMTYGQTLGLVHGSTRSRTYWWGLTGCFVKGALWFGVGAALLSLTARGLLLHPLHALAMSALAVAGGLVGRRCLNGPMDPPRRYPVVYFSHRATDADDPDRPRSESWGGLLGGLSAVLLYGSVVLRAHGLWALTFVGAIAGGLGFSIGEAIQAWGLGRGKGPAGEWVDWWKVMEMTFGLIGGAGIGVVVALAAPLHPTAAPAACSPALAVTALLAWGALTVGDSFGSATAERYLSLPMLCGMLPIVGLSAAPQLAAAALAGGFILYLSSLNVLSHWRRQVRSGAHTAAHLLALIAAGASAYLAAWCPARSALAAIALTQTALVPAKSLADSGPGACRQRVRRLGPALPTVVSFLLLSSALWVLVR